MSTWRLFFEWKRFPEVFKEDPLEKEKGETEWKKSRWKTEGSDDFWEASIIG